MAKQGKERIITAAFQLFLQKGYNGVSLTDIIKETQLSKGAIYHHFVSKHAIYIAVLETYFFKFLEGLSTEDESLNFHQRIQLRYTYFVELISYIEESGPVKNAYPIRNYFMFQLESERDETIRERVQTAMRAYREEVVQIVDSAIKRGEIKEGLSAEIIALQLMSMIEGLALHYSALEKDSKAFLSKKYEEIISSYLNLISAMC